MLKYKTDFQYRTRRTKIYIIVFAAFSLEVKKSFIFVKIGVLCL